MKRRTDESFFLRSPFASSANGTNMIHSEEINVADAQVKCINKPHRDSSHEHITHLGGDDWRWTRDQVVASIEAGTNTFYTFAGGKRADVLVREGPSGKYVQTRADGVWSNNLLSLPECPRS